MRYLVQLFRVRAFVRSLCLLYLFAIVGIGQLLAAPGLLSSSASSISADALQGASAIAGPLVIIYTLFSMTSGAKFLIALCEFCMFMFIYMNPQAVANFFSFGGASSLITG